MKKVTHFLGLFLIILGTVTLLSSRLQQLNDSNWPLFIGLLCIIAGILFHIRSIKRESRY